MASLLQPFARIVLVENIRSAVEALKVIPIDVVLSDYDLGEGMTGADLLEAVSVVWPDIRRVLYSGSLVDHALLFAHAFVVKPANLSDLLTAVLAS